MTYKLNKDNSVTLFDDPKNPVVIDTGHGESLLVKKISAVLDRAIGNEDFVNVRIKLKVDLGAYVPDDEELEISSIMRLKILSIKLQTSIYQKLYRDEEFLKLFSLADYIFDSRITGTPETTEEIKEEIMSECTRHKRCSKRCNLKNFCDSLKLNKGNIDEFDIFS
jgi:hypothetical protein